MLPGIRARIQAAALDVGVLLRQLPESQLALTDSESAEIMLRNIPVGERADVLHRRLDLCSAERRLAAITANIGVATAEWFPRLSIFANGGFQALAIGDMIKPASQTRSIIPLIYWRIFDGGRVKTQIRASEERQKTAAHVYEKTVLSALTDAKRSLNNYQRSLESIHVQRAAIESARRSYGHAKQGLKLGDIALADLLEVVRCLHEANYLYAKMHTNAATDLVALAACRT